MRTCEPGLSLRPSAGFPSSTRRRFVGQRLQLRERGLVRRAEPRRFSSRCARCRPPCRRAAPRTGESRLRRPRLPAGQLILQVLRQRRVIEALDRLRHVRRDRDVEGPRAALVSRPAQRQHHPRRVDSAFEQLRALLVGRVREERRQVGRGRLLERLEREALEQFLVVENVIRQRRDADQRLLDRRSDCRRREPRRSSPSGASRLTSFRPASTMARESAGACCGPTRFAISLPRKPARKFDDARPADQRIAIVDGRQAPRAGSSRRTAPDSPLP